MASRSEQYQQRQQLQRPQQAPLQYSQPTQEQKQSGQAKPRSYSIQSQKTHRSSGSKNDFHETHEEKEAKRLHSKADPTLAMNEAEPCKPKPNMLVRPKCSTPEQCWSVHIPQLYLLKLTADLLFVPAMVAAMKSELNQISLRAIQHKDSWGNPIGMI